MPRGHPVLSRIGQSPTADESIPVLALVIPTSPARSRRTRALSSRTRQGQRRRGRQAHQATPHHHRSRAERSERRSPPRLRQQSRVPISDRGRAVIRQCRALAAILPTSATTMVENHFWTPVVATSFFAASSLQTYAMTYSGAVFITISRVTASSVIAASMADHSRVSRCSWNRGGCMMGFSSGRELSAECTHVSGSHRPVLRRERFRVNRLRQSGKNVSTGAAMVFTGNGGGSAATSADVAIGDRIVERGPRPSTALTEPSVTLRRRATHPARARRHPNARSTLRRTRGSRAGSAPDARRLA